MTEPGEKPKHKPSQKHTLDEVLRSLQDMIRHELAGAPGSHSATRAQSANLRTDLEKALDTLKSDIEDSLLHTGRPAPFEALDSLLPVLGAPPDSGARLRSGKTGQTAVLMDPPPYSAHKELPSLSTDQPPNAPARPNERNLPFLDDIMPTGDAPTASRESRPSPARPGLAGVPPTNGEAYPPDTLVSAAAGDAEAIAREEALLADSIPVLTDAVEFPEAGDEAEESLQIEVPLPSPDRARDIAIRVGARLNIELRKSGRRGLSTPVIIRLAQLLRDALAQAESNVDNSGNKSE